jgi:hypothetical protein
MQNTNEDYDKGSWNFYLKSLTVFGGKTIDCTPNIVELKSENTEYDRNVN